MSDKIEFTRTEFTYLVCDVLYLRELLKCNLGVISKALALALEDDLFKSIPLEFRAVFIVEQCERANEPIPDGKANKSFNLKELK